MSLRLSITAALALGLTALAPAAPAPLVKKERGRTSDDALALSGTWKVIEQTRPGIANRLGRVLVMRADRQTKIKIENDRFTYLYHDGRDYVPSTSYEMKLAPRAWPKALDLTYNTSNYTLTLKGIYKLEGNKLTLLYVSTYSGNIRVNLNNGGSEERPTDWDNPPTNAIQLVLEKE